LALYLAKSPRRQRVQLQDLGGTSMTELDPINTDPDKYKVIFENDRVRVLDYRDTPGAKTKPHRHPNPSY